MAHSNQQTKNWPARYMLFETICTDVYFDHAHNLLVWYGKLKNVITHTSVQKMDSYYCMPELIPSFLNQCNAIY